MEDIKVCRICLLMDVKLFNFYSYPLETYYDILVGNTTSVQELPKYTCYECSAQLNKFYLFREKCLRGQEALLGLRHSCVKVTGDVIKQLDKNIFQLSSKIGFTEVTFINIEPQNTREVDNDEIKIEPFEIVDNGDYFDEKEVKIEDSDNHSVFSNNDTLLSSDDDEPLSKHKEKKKEKRGRKRKKSDVEKRTNVDIKVESDLALADSATVTQETIADVKPKRGRPRKNDGKNKSKKEVKPRRTNNTGGVSDEDIDLESYCNIVTLTEEEQKEEIRQRQKSSNYLNAIYQCKLCFKGFIDAQAWEHHVSKHEPSAGDVECQICKFRFKTKRILQKHASNHEKKYACKSCSYVSKTTCYHQTNGKMALSAAERQRRYREKRKLNPEIAAEVKRKDLERYHSRKKLVKDMTPKEHKKIKRQWQIRNKMRRERRKALHNVLINDTKRAQKNKETVAD